MVWLKISQRGLCFSSHQFLRRAKTSLRSSRGCGADAGEMLVVKREKTLLSKSAVVWHKHLLTAEHFSDQGWPPAGSQ